MMYWGGMMLLSLGVCLAIEGLEIMAWAALDWVMVWMRLVCSRE